VQGKAVPGRRVAAVCHPKYGVSGQAITEGARAGQMIAPVRPAGDELPEIRVLLRGPLVGADEADDDFNATGTKASGLPPRQGTDLDVS
jgi:hypothetical protein